MMILTKKEFNRRVNDAVNKALNKEREHNYINRRFGDLWNRINDLSEDIRRIKEGNKK